MVIYSNSITSRLRYIVQFIGQEIIAEEIKLTTDIEAFRLVEGPKINYSAANITDTEIWVQPHSILFETGVKPQFPVTFTHNSNKAFFRTGRDFPFDIFAASFYLLSRYEEYLPHEKDEFGRFGHINSIAFKEDFLKIPLINYWVRDFVSTLQKKWPSYKVPVKQFRFIPTYDIDEGFCYKEKPFRRTFGGYARSFLFGRWSEITERRKVLSGKMKDPYDSFDWISDLHNRNAAINSYVFFLVAGKTSKLDKNISPFNPVWKEKMRSFMSLPSFKPGIHPSWQSGDDPSLIKEEINTLKEIIGSTTNNSRQHYIRFNLPTGFRELIKAGIQQDFSMGYGSINGFRASTATPYYWYDLEREEKTNLLLYPFCFMDANSFYEQKMSPAEAAVELKDYFEVVRSVNGTLITIWHNTILGTHKRFSGWREVYQDFMQVFI